MIHFFAKAAEFNKQLVNFDFLTWRPSFQKGRARR